MVEVAAGRIDEHIRALTDNMGVRLAGSPAERHAAQYIAAEMEDLGADVSVEMFPITLRLPPVECRPYGWGATIAPRAAFFIIGPTIPSRASDWRRPRGS